MFGSSVGSGLTLGKVISGISKTLGVVNQVIPLYKEAKPMINNAKTIMSALKSFNSKSDTPKISIKNIDTKTKNTIKEINVNKVNSPSFFL